MNILRIALIMSTLVTSLIAYAQESVEGQLISRNEVRNSSFVSYEFADSFAKAGNKARAGELFSNVEPLFLIWGGVSPATLDQEFDKFNLSKDAHKAYTERFMKVWNTPKTIMYEQLEREDQNDKEILSKYTTNANDTFSGPRILKVLHNVDSVRLHIFREYVALVGWPTMETGSLFCGNLVQYDEESACFYLPYLKKAVMAGQADYRLYNRMLSECKAPNLEVLLKDYPNYTSYDLSMILDSHYPADTLQQRIEQTIRTPLPVKYFYFDYSCKNESDYNAIFKSAHYNRKPQFEIAHNIIKRLEQYHHKAFNVNEYIPYRFGWSKSGSKMPKLTLYLFY